MNSLWIQSKINIKSVILHLHIDLIPCKPLSEFDSSGMLFKDLVNYLF